MANLVLWLFFVLGQLLSILKRAYFTVTGPNTAATASINSYGAFFKAYWVPLLVRFGLGAGMFWGVAYYPDFVARLAGWAGVSINFVVPKVPFVAFLCGLVADFALDWIVAKVPFLQGQVPQIPQVVPVQAGK